MRPDGTHFQKGLSTKYHPNFAFLRILYSGKTKFIEYTNLYSKIISEVGNYQQKAAIRKAE